MKDNELNAVKAELKQLSARIGALEKLLERIVRQKPVSEKQLHQALREAGLANANSSSAKPQLGSNRFAASQRRI